MRSIAASSAGGEIDISVVIPAYLGALTIEDCLTSVECATAGRMREVIVVDSSADATSEVVRQRFPDVVLIQSEKRLTAGAARNCGARAARGKLVFFTDQDCIVPVDWVDRLERYFENPKVGGAGGAVGIRNLSNLSGCAMYFLEFLTHFPRSGPPQRDKNFLVGCNSAFRRDVFDVVRFPDQTLGEDVLLSYNLRRHGFRMVYDPRVEVRHKNREGWREFARYNRTMGRAAATYHQVLQPWWAPPFLQLPLLAFLAPLVVLPRIAFESARSRWSYFCRFLVLSPMCLLGNLVWASGFRRQLIETRAQTVAGPARPPS